MKISKRWLQELLTSNQDLDSLIEKLNYIGLESENINNDIVEIDIPFNRGDCLSVLGIAREISSLTQTKVNYPKYKVEETIKEKIEIINQDDHVCPKYLGRVIFRDEEPTFPI